MLVGWILAGFILVVVSIVSLLISSSVEGPLRAFVARMEDIAHGDGDLTQRLDDSARDEFGRVAGFFNSFLAKIEATIRQIGHTSQTLSASAEEFTALSRQLAGNADSTSTQATSVSAASSEINSNVQSVAAAAEEMSASIKEIAKNTTEAERVATQRGGHHAKHQRGRPAPRSGQRRDRRGRQGHHLHRRADQPAGAERHHRGGARRRGGQGLCRRRQRGQRAGQADRQGHRRHQHQDQQHPVRAPRAPWTPSREIATIINRIKEIQTSVASAVEQQAATASEIGRNINHVAAASSEIAGNIGKVAETAHSTSTGTGETETAANELASMAAGLQSLVSGFRTGEDRVGSSAADEDSGARPIMPLNGHNTRSKAHDTTRPGEWRAAS